ncbi:D-alanyl-D-alanine carboxypeptidase/D-alanyl-D-alanine endopeptidase [Asaia krungthepensis]|uniref:D-alanyl-D-alanine carboxypeptidase n=1 Tax=Asaia krungthepensis NRIC 0535 TaxID=1307925 RepID=A0ABQ0Q3S4_9PROT|nr:D-alanyl-D-alanine carboxypeptidase/D-alanyl-D-alanine-endopeptidase [Asaia krungthepensis]GBQ90058.1 D-alanyl-D-alanine carboxypeptidase [Asaia krungthepensis NRIC 0535]
MRLAALLLASTIGLAACAPRLPPDLQAGDALSSTLAPLLAPLEATGARWGILVTDTANHTLYAHNATQRFIPASNTKLFTTAAALAARAILESNASTAGTRLYLIPHRGKSPDLVLLGAADPALSDSSECLEHCLVTLASAVSAAGIRSVHKVIGDDTLFPDIRWGEGWSWNNLASPYGTAVSALTLDNNIGTLTLSPALKAGLPARLTEISPPYRFANRVETTATGPASVRMALMPGQETGTLNGTFPRDASPMRVSFGLVDPALTAAEHLRARLETLGIHTAHVMARHRAADETRFELPARALLLAQHPQMSLGNDIRVILKDSQNLHAELLLRRLGLIAGDGSVEAGQRERMALLAQSGVIFNRLTLADGSGMSSYNRVTPRDIVSLLLWADRQPWGKEWEEDLPLAGEDGTLAKRFQGTMVAGHFHAKTGTLNGTHALSGVLTAASGRKLMVSILLNDVPEDLPATSPQATEAMDRIVERVAAMN